MHSLEKRYSDIHKEYRESVAAYKSVIPTVLGEKMK